MAPEHTTAARAVVAALAVVCACDKRATSPDDAAPPSISVTLAVDGVDEPREDARFVAGEAVRLDVAVTGGVGPYQLEVSGRAVGGSGVALTATTQVAPASRDATGVEAVAHAALNPEAPSGRYVLSAVITDASGARATSPPTEISLVGADAPQLPPPATPGIEVLDIAGRRRRDLVRGERVRVRALVGDGWPDVVRLEIVDPDGLRVLARDGLPVVDGGLDTPLAIPRLARPGSYELRIVARGRDPVLGRFAVDAPPFPATSRLEIDRLALRGGPDGRAPRTAHLRRGETVVVEARVGGAGGALALGIRLRRDDTVVAADDAVAHVTPVVAAPDARVVAAGVWTVPANLVPGSYTLDVEVVEGDRVSTRFRAVVVD